jgi:hypothetical protein
MILNTPDDLPIAEAWLQAIGSAHRLEKEPQIEEAEYVAYAARLFAEHLVDSNIESAKSWARLAIQVYDLLIVAAESLSMRYEYRACQVIAFVTRHLGGAAGDPIFDQERVERLLLPYMERGFAEMDELVGKIREESTVNWRESEDFLQFRSCLETLRMIAPAVSAWRLPTVQSWLEHYSSVR